MDFKTGGEGGQLPLPALPDSVGPDSLHRTVISVEYDKLARHGNHKDLKCGL